MGPVAARAPATSDVNDCCISAICSVRSRLASCSACARASSASTADAGTITSAALKSDGKRDEKGGWDGGPTEEAAERRKAKKQERQWEEQHFVRRMRDRNGKTLFKVRLAPRGRSLDSLEGGRRVTARRRGCRWPPPRLAEAHVPPGM